jgi:uncharacterized membrane protein
MKKREITKGNYQILKKELDFFEQNGFLPTLQKEEMLNHYEVIGRLNFIRVLLTVGAFLLGIGVLSFVASNWMHMGDTFKFLLIVLSIVGVNLAGLKMEKNHPKTARTMHYLGVLFFGAGIFLIGQMFNFGGEYQSALLVWALGSIPIGYVLKDRIILIFTTVLLFIYSFGTFVENDISIPYLMVAIIPVLYFINKQINYSRLFTFSINALSIQFLIFVLATFIDFDSETVSIFILFAVGIGMLFIPVNEKIKKVFEWQGHMIHSVAGLMLTMPEIWEELNFGEPFAYVFGLLYFLFILFLMKRGSLFSILILCALILRFYIDLSLDFLPKSMVFIIGGAILMSFGYYFESERKKGAKNHAKREEK